MMHQNQHPNAVAAPPSPPLSLDPHSAALLRQTPDHHVSGQQPPPLIMASAAATPLGRVRLADLLPYDGAPSGPYLGAVEALSGSLMRHNAAVIELGCEDAALMRCGLESARFYFRARAQSSSGKGSRGVYLYRPGRVEDADSSPPCMSDIFRCMGKAARAALGAIARHLRLRSNVFNHLLDDNPLPTNEISSSVLVASYTMPLQSGKGAISAGKLATNFEVEKGLLTLVSSDVPGLQVCDPNGRWYVADFGSVPENILLLTGKALSHATGGLRPATSYRNASEYIPNAANAGRSSLAFRLMPQGNAVLDCSPITAAGHVIPQSYVPISVSQFMDDLSSEDVMCIPSDNTYVSRNTLNKEPSLRSVLSDSLSGAFLEDAMLVSCGHSFGGLMLRRVIETARCTLCNAEIETEALIPNHSLRAAATAVKHENDRRLLHNAALRKRRKEVSDHRDIGDVPPENGASRGVQYPFSVNEKVVIKGNRRTPDKFVGKEAVITSQCLNGWYLLKLIDSGENIRLQYRSLRKILNSQNSKDRCTSQPAQNSS